MRFLLEKGISPNTRDRWGGTPLNDAELGEHSDVIDQLKHRGAEPGESQHVDSESTATEEAAHYGDTDAVVELLWAASENHIDGLRRCLAHGIPVSAADYDGRTALHLAASDGQIDAVKYLLAHGHPIHVRDRWNATPLDDARRESRDAVVELLSTAEKDFHTLTIDVDLQEITRTSAFVKRYTAAHDIDALVNHRANVVPDEILGTLIDHGSDDAECHQITLEFDVTAEQLEIVVTSDGSEFDPLSQSAADLEDAEMSGMGRKLIRKLTDNVSYTRSNDNNVVTLAFRFVAPSAAAA